MNRVISEEFLTAIIHDLSQLSEGDRLDDVMEQLRCLPIQPSGQANSSAIEWINEAKEGIEIGVSDFAVKVTIQQALSQAINLLGQPPSGQVGEVDLSSFSRWHDQNCERLQWNRELADYGECTCGLEEALEALRTQPLHLWPHRSAEGD